MLKRLVVKVLQAKRFVRGARKQDGLHGGAQRGIGVLAEGLESRLMLATGPLPTDDYIPFKQIVIDKNPGTTPVVKLLADLTNNGLEDAVVGHENNLGGGGLFWYQYPTDDNPNQTWTKYTIDAGADVYEQAAAADISGHHDANGNPVNDLVVLEDGTIVWYENPLGDGINPTTVSSWTKHVVGTISQGVTHELFLVDLTGNGLLDIVTNTTIFFQNSPGQWTQISTANYDRTEKGLYPFDSGSGLGAIDLLGTGNGPSYDVGWYENPRDYGGNPETNQWIFHPIGPAYGDYVSGDGVSYAAMDVSGDGKEDIITADGENGSGPPYLDGGMIWWQAPANDITGTWIPHTIDSSITDVHNIVLADMDNDGQTDILAFEQDQSPQGRLMILYNEGGTGQNWLEQTLASDSDPAMGGGEGGHNESVGDANGDGYLDILTSPHGFYTQINPISFYLNEIPIDGIVQPNIVSSPVSQIVNAGDSVTFSVDATGSGPLTFQWQLNGLNIPGATNGSYTINSVPAGDNGDVFRCIVGNGAGLIPSGNATLTVNNVTTGTITGNLFNDQNADGVEDGTDAGLAGRTVYLDLNNDASPDPGDPTAVTDSNGNYTFNNVTPGTYQLGVVLPQGWQVTTNGAALPSVAVTAGQTITAPAIGNAFVAISGFVFADTNGNGVQDNGEGPAVGQELFIDLNNNGTLDPGDPTATTDSNGDYEFTGLAAGTYTVDMIIPADSHESFPIVGGGQKVTVTTTPASSIDFAIAPGPPVGGISGKLVVDPEGGGQTDGDDTAFPPAGQQVYLDLSNAGSYQAGDPTTTADAKGNYSFTNLADGTYTVRFVPAKGYVQNYPTDDAGQTVIVSGQTVEDVILGEVKGTPILNGSPFAAEITSKTPVAAIGGEKEKVTLRVTNSQGVAYHGPLDVDIYLGTDNSIDGNADTVLSTVIKNGVLKKGVTTFNLRYTVPTTLQTDSYYVLASVTAGVGGSAAPATAASGAGIAVAPPTVTFDATVRGQSAVSLTPGVKDFADVDLTNSGNVDASGDVTINLYASTDGTLDSNSILVDVFKAPIKLAPSHSRSYRIAFTPPAELAAGDYFLLAQASLS